MVGKYAAAQGTMSVMVAVYRAPMRSRSDAVELQCTIDRARRLGICGFGQFVDRPREHKRLARRVDRFADLDEGSFVWTRDPSGRFWLGRVSGPYLYDADEEATAVDLVHTRPCEWLPAPILEQDAPAAVIATFGRGGRNFQKIHHASIAEDTQRIWDARRVP
jgi:hypothetical protein